VTCPLGDLTSGTGATRTIVVLASAGPAINTATASSSTADPDGASATATTTVTSSGTTTISTNVTGTITVPSDQFLCIGSGVRVTGSVTVKPGGGLVATNATISGSIDSDGAQFVTLCGAGIGGSVTIKNGVQMVRVGGASVGCAPNVIGGSLKLTGNLAGIEAYRNTVGPTTITGNHGASPLTADGTPAVEGNNVTGSLSCSGNVPPATNRGIANTATGAKTGECATL
jgi:hexosaminidase